MSFAELVIGTLLRVIIYPVLALCMAFMLLGLLNGLFSIAEMQVGATNPFTDIWWLVLHRTVAGGLMPPDIPIFALDFFVAIFAAIFAALISRLSRAIPSV